MDENTPKDGNANQDASLIPSGALRPTGSKNLRDNGVQIDRMRDMQRLQVRTHNSLYEITVIDGRSGDILVRGGLFFQELTPACLAGATLGGSFSKRRGIYVGFQMELRADTKRIITSPVQTVQVLGS